MIVSTVAGLVALALAASGWAQRRSTYGAGTYVVAAAAATVWCWSIAAFEQLDRPGHYPYAVVGLWLAAVSTSVAAIFVMARRAVRSRWSPPRLLLALFVLEPVLVFALEVTNPLHGLMGSKPEGHLEFGMAYQLHAAYCAALVLASVVALATRAAHADQAHRRQVMVLQALVVAVVVVEIARLDMTQYIAVAGLAVLHHAMFGRGLNDLVPIDRAAAVDEMADVVVFFDDSGRLVDLNASARRTILARDGRLPDAGASVDDVLGAGVTLSEGADQPFVLGDGPDALQLVARCTPLTGRDEAVAGWMVVCREAAPRRRDRPVLLDPVTGLMTRAQLDHSLRQAVEQLADGIGPLSIALLDVDGFKQINDTYGHVAGDEVLLEVAARVGGVAGGVLTGRFGGDEFVAILVGRTAADASRVAEAMRAAVAATPVRTDDGLVPVTVSIGVAEHRGGDVSDLLRAADDAMYGAKRAGRNRVGVAARKS
ncbi:sensor domain-containing diguanylate cyclase [Aeromicrobium endophyticum]|uniref:GGDEF domain-containing protein n=1 Tax=Aeromicrobium endophyticum TaxID=2292704 RepID=A0A371P4V8_9ACTN|nr:GGDEF domain-containing protein [Aeromicrobium endophyticum]REK70983.1 GGDEF domain-containing protein [Aeromicrobium endophyticum]